GFRAIGLIRDSQDIYVRFEFPFFLFKFDGVRGNFHGHAHSGHISGREEEWCFHRATDITCLAPRSMTLQLSLDRLSGKEIDRLHVAIPAARSNDRLT